MWYGTPSVASRSSSTSAMSRNARFLLGTAGVSLPAGGKTRSYLGHERRGNGRGVKKDKERRDNERQRETTRERRDKSVYMNKYEM